MCGTSVLHVRGQRFHGLVHCCTPWPLDLKHLELQASSTRTWPFCHISLPKTEPPLPSTRRHPSAGQGPVPTPDSPLQWRRELTSTAARSSISIFPGGTAAPPPARLTRFPQAGVNQEHCPACAHFVTECPGQQLVVFPSSLSENKCLSDHCERRGQSGNPKEGCKEES